MSAQEKYVAAAYLVVFLVVLLYVVIMAAKLSRLGSAVAELTELARAKRAEHPTTSAPKQVKVG